MRSNTMVHGRKFTIVVLVLAGLCLFRVLSVVADDQVEVYPSTEAGSKTEYSFDDEEKAEIRLTRPGEASARIEDQGYDLVPGAERLMKAQNAISVPVKRGRGIASEPSMPAVESAHPSSAVTTLSSEPIEPKPFTSADARARSEELHAETIGASNHRIGKQSYGLKAEPRVTTEIEPAIPQSYSRDDGRVGTQELSLIVSDYGYFPNQIFVTQNVPVKIYMTTSSKSTLCFMADDLGLKKGVNPGKIEEITFVPTAARDYRFYCPVKSIEGRITVREAPVAKQSLRGVASYERPRIERESAGRGNEPKNAAVLRSLIED